MLTNPLLPCTDVKCRSRKGGSDEALDSKWPFGSLHEHTALQNKAASAKMPEVWFEFCSSWVILFIPWANQNQGCFIILNVRKNISCASREKSWPHWSQWQNSHWFHWGQDFTLNKNSCLMHNLNGNGFIYEGFKNCFREKYITEMQLGFYLAFTEQSMFSWPV